MSLQRVSSSLWQWISRPSGFQHPVASYVWTNPTSGGTTLIDPAADLTPQVLRDQRIARPGHILITHFQAEHAAGCRNFPDASVHVPAGDEYLAGGAAGYEKLITRWAAPWDWTSRGDYRGHLAGAHNERPLKEALLLAMPIDASLELPGCAFIATPGHGKNAITILASVDDKTVAFCGDLICGDGQLWNWFDCEWDYGLLTGQRALLRSGQRLQSERIELLCPAHGGMIEHPAAALAILAERLAPLLEPGAPGAAQAINFLERDSPAPMAGFREILPQLHQWRDGNLNILVSASGHGLAIDDGLCYWKPIDERAAHHRDVIARAKKALCLKQMEVVIPTHVHGDHLENIPELAALEGARVVCLETIADAFERPYGHNFSSPLWWYDTRYDHVKIDRRIANGATFQWREYELEFFHLGGQTWYHAGITALIRSVRTLFVGDAIDYRSQLIDPVLCYNDAEPETRGWAFALDRMIEREPDLLVCGHGSAIWRPMELLQTRRAAWTQRIADFRKISAHADLRRFFDPPLTREAFNLALE